MPKFIRYFLYIIIFAVSFFIFFYWMFPYDILRDKFIGEISRSSDGKYDLSIGELEPYWFTGVRMIDVKFAASGEGKPMLVMKSVTARASLISLIFKSPRISFDAEVGEDGEVSGAIHFKEETIDLSLYLDDMQLSEIGVISSIKNPKIAGGVSGSVDLSIDRMKWVKSIGKVKLDLANLKLSQIKMEELGKEIAELNLTKGRGSSIECTIGKGFISFDSMKLVGGDLDIDVKGKIFLNVDTKNTRFDLNGSFKPSEKLATELSYIIALIERGRLQDGSYPLTVSGFLSGLAVKLGTFTLPL